MTEFLSVPRCAFLTGSSDLNPRRYSASPVQWMNWETNGVLQQWSRMIFRKAKISCRFILRKRKNLRIRKHANKSSQERRSSEWLVWSMWWLLKFFHMLETFRIRSNVIAWRDLRRTVIAHTVLLLIGPLGSRRIFDVSVRDGTLWFGRRRMRDVTEWRIMWFTYYAKEQKFSFIKAG